MAENQPYLCCDVIKIRGEITGSPNIVEAVIKSTDSLTRNRRIGCNFNYLIEIGGFNYGHFIS